MNHSGRSIAAPHETRASLAYHAQRLSELLLFAVLPIGFTTVVLFAAAQNNHFAVDFHHHFWPAARQMSHGVSPFPTPHDAVTLGSFIYPAFAAAVIVPFVFLPRELADPFFVALLGAALFGALYILRVRDWRCFGIALLWPPVFHALHTANFTILIALGLAVLWRVRSRPFVAGLVLGTMIALKIFLWPLIVWFIAARRFRAAAWSVAFAAAVTAAAWATVGFAGLTYYPHLVSKFDRISAPATYTVVGFAMKAGLSQPVAQAAAWCIGILVLTAAIALTRRDGLGPRSFAAIIFAAIVLSPIVWLHYFTLLLVPLAILRPRVGLLWIAPLVAWPLAVGPGGPSFTSLPLLAGAGALLLIAAGSWRGVAPSSSDRRRSAVVEAGA